MQPISCGESSNNVVSHFTITLLTAQMCPLVFSICSVGSKKEPLFRPISLPTPNITGIKHFNKTMHMISFSHHPYVSYPQKHKKNILFLQFLTFKHLTFKVLSLLKATQKVKVLCVKAIFTPKKIYIYIYKIRNKKHNNKKA